MLFTFLWILLAIVVIVWLVFCLSLILHQISSEDAFFFALIITIICVFLALGPTVCAFMKSYACNEGFDIDYAVVTEQSKVLKLKKDRIVSESRELNKELTSPDILALKDKAYLEQMVTEIQKTENLLYHTKLKLFERIVKHNGECRYWWGGKWVVDTNRFPLLEIKLNKGKQEE